MHKIKSTKSKQMHPLNSLLSEPEKSHIDADELHSWNEIQETADRIEAIIGGGEVVVTLLIAKLVRAVGTHQSLKYEFTVSIANPASCSSAQ